MPKLILVNGMPGTGKTTLAKRLSIELDMPVIHKDALKEFLYESLHATTREESRLLGASVIEMIYILIGEYMHEGRDLMVECPMHIKYAKPVLERIVHETGAVFIEVNCHTQKDIRRQRIAERAQGGSRHQAHILAETPLQIDDPEPDMYMPLGIGAEIILDTTNFEGIDYHALTNQLQYNIKENI